MKSKFFLFAVLASLLSACNTGAPEENNLLGAWYEKSNGDNVKSLVFSERGILRLQQGELEKQYSYTLLSDSKIKITHDTNKTEDAVTPWVTSYSIKHNTLIIDSFPHSEPLRNFKLHKGTRIQSVTITDSEEAKFEEILRITNPLLKDFPFDTVVVIGSDSELQAICPEKIDKPMIDFESQCLIFVPLMLSSVNDEVEEQSLYCNPNDNTFEYIAIIKKCTECYAAIDYKYLYNVYPFPKDKLAQLRTTINAIYY